MVPDPGQDQYNPWAESNHQEKCGGVISVQITYSLIHSCGLIKFTTYCQIFDVLPPLEQQQIQAKIPTTTAKQHKRMKVSPKYAMTPHSHPWNSFGEASSTGGLIVGMAALAACWEFLTNKEDTLVRVAFQLTKWELQANITYERIYNYEQFYILFSKNFKNFTIY